MSMGTMLRIGIVMPGFSENERDWFIPALLNFVKSLSRHAEVEVFSLHYPYKKCQYNVFGSTVHSYRWEKGAWVQKSISFFAGDFLHREAASKKTLRHISFDVGG